MDQILTPSQIETADEDRELSMSELDIVAGSDCYIHNPRGAGHELLRD